MRWDREVHGACYDERLGWVGSYYYNGQGNGWRVTLRATSGGRPTTRTVTNEGEARNVLEVHLMDLLALEER